MGYRKSEQSTDTVFEVTPEDPPPFPTTFTVAGKIRAIVEIIIFTFILFLLVNLFLPRWIGMPVGTVLSFLLVRWIWKRGKLKERVQPTVMKNRVPSRFIVNPNGVTLNGAFFKKADIHRVLTRNEVLDDLDHTVVTVSTSDSRMYQAGRE